MTDDWLSTQLFLGDDSGEARYLDVTREMPGEKLLVLAVLEHALHDYERWSTARDLSAKNAHAFAELCRWFEGGAVPGRWTFRFCCEVLGLERSAVRRRLMRLQLDRRLRSNIRDPLSVNIGAGLHRSRRGKGGFASRGRAA